MYKKKIIAIGLLASTVLLASMTTLQQVPQQQPRPEPKLVNIKVLPKKLTFRQVDHLMDEWSRALGVRCNFCHDNKDKSLDIKPEKEMARKMFVMEGKINKKFFGAKKDSVGLMAETGVTCNSCHRGVAHPKVVYANVPGPRPGGFGGPGQGGPGGPGGFGGPGQGAPGQGGPGGQQRPQGAPVATPPATPPGR
ncbi:MAG: c-type cytochrome [Mucilaginibacter sp.]